MTNDLESAFRSFLKPIFREVVEEVLSTRRSIPQQASKIVPQDERFLLRAREAAKRLAISERHLFKLTSEGAIPCVRIGRLVHYSVQTIEQWIRDTESTEAPAKQTGQIAKRKTTSKVTSATPKAKPKRKKTSKPKNSSQTKSEKAVATKSRKRSAKRTEQPERVSPFAELMKEIGIDREKLGPLSNGELMRIAEVELPVYHGWMHLGREMPEAALDKLRNHFRKRE